MIKLLNFLSYFKLYNITSDFCLHERLNQLLSATDVQKLEDMDGGSKSYSI